MTNLRKLLFATFLLLSFTACEKEEKTTKEKELIIRTNLFISNCMSTFYLWNNEMPNINPEKEEDPIAYFKKLCSPKDKWSIITDNAQELLNELKGSEETFGYKLAYGKFKNSQKCFAVIQYVYPQSPAAEKLKRGDIIIQANGEDLTENTLNKLNQHGTIRLTMGIATNGLIAPDVTISLSSKKMDLDPVLISSVIEKGNHKIGYLMYTSFIGDYNEKSLMKAFNDFKNKGITDLVLDLRYNHGGDDDASIFMCSAIAPKSVAIKDKILSKEKWNTECQKEFEKDIQYNKLIYRYFKPLDCNLNLPSSKVYILTTEETASASEYTAICLKPFMDVILIGSQTHGKYTTMSLFTPTIEKDNKLVPDEELSNWLIIPVCSRYTNIDDYPNFSEGLQPDHVVNEILIDGAPLGQENEPLLAKAIELITGQTPKAFRVTQPTFNFEKIEKPLNDIRSNRIILHK